MFRTELHCHTEEMSPSCHESGHHVIEKYIEAGYRTLVITNHATPYVFYDKLRDMEWDEKIERYFDVLDGLISYAGDRLCVLPGMEITFTENHNDYLVFGITRDKLKGCPDMIKWGLRRFHEYAMENEMLVIKAHPFRFHETTVSPDDVDGFEIFNGHQYEFSHNDIAKMWAEHFTRHKLILTSGTDSHFDIMTPDAGIITAEPILSSDALLSVLRSGEYELITSPLGDVEY